MSYSAYKKTQTSTDSPTQLEYRLFGQITGALMRARDEGHSGVQLMDSLDWNRRLWVTLSSDCAVPGNKLPDELRAQIVSLSLFVSRYTSQVFRGKADIATLIEINQAIMAGLETQMTSATQNRNKVAQEMPSQAPDVRAQHRAELSPTQTPSIGQDGRQTNARSLGPGLSA